MLAQGWLGCGQRCKCYSAAPVHSQILILVLVLVLVLVLALVLVLSLFNVMIVITIIITTVSCVAPPVLVH